MQSGGSNPPWVQSPYVRSLLAGSLAGISADMSLFPIDTIKTRLQSSAGFAASGGFHGVYRGVGSALVGSMPSAALFFVTYDSAKRYLRRVLPSPSSSPLVPILAGSAGETAGCLVRVPVEVVKQRTQARHHPSSAAALRAILALRHTDSGGGGGSLRVLRELYRGAGATLLREVPFTALQFPLWEALRAWWVRRRHQGAAAARHIAADDCPTLPSACFGSVAGGVAAALTTPLDVLKTRLMLAKEPVGALDMAARIWKQGGGWRAYFAGVGPRVLWISVGGAVFLGSYQAANNFLGGSGQEEDDF
ncbi:mitochondrial carrier domain-containing protein [Lineolata rhizophorae]|uniref:Mitochondrial carrier domain-containing protein n=1 Tax=Lineolata rhizophorae TaxID=578093 RepID=A0A6A6PAI0_9PEZI|nr:mitochondrial carrier domain-containing protein [Lineolata rhizophorae]